MTINKNNYGEGASSVTLSSIFCPWRFIVIMDMALFVSLLDKSSDNFFRSACVMINPRGLGLLLATASWGSEDVAAGAGFDGGEALVFEALAAVSPGFATGAGAAAVAAGAAGAGAPGLPATGAAGFAGAPSAPVPLL